MITNSEQWQGHFIEDFLDKPYTFDFDGYDHSMTPIGNGERTTLTLGRDGYIELTIEEYDAYSGYIVFSAVAIRGKWELRSLEKDRLIIYIHDPKVEIIEGKKNEMHILNHLKQNCVHINVSNMGYAPCPKSREGDK
jgi:hypothetical protein